MNEQLCDLRAVRLVRRQREDHLHRADQVAVGEGGQEQPAALLDVAGDSFEHAVRVLVRERRQMANRCSSGDAVDQHARERIELLTDLERGKTTNLQPVGV